MVLRAEKAWRKERTSLYTSIFWADGIR